MKNDPAPAVVFALVLLVLVGCIYWVYRDFKSGGRRAVEKQITETQKHSKQPTVQPALPPVDSPEEKPTAETKSETKKKTTPKTYQPDSGLVEYAIDFDAEPERGHSRFLEDTESGVRIWVSGGLVQNHLVYRGEARDGLAHGRGKAILALGSNDHSPQRIEGEFRDGLFMGEEPFSDPIVALLNNRFLIQLASLRDDDAQFWYLRYFASDNIQVERCGRYPPDLLVVAPTGMSGLEEEKIQELMKQASALYRERCGEVSEARVEVVPRDYRRVAKASRTKFEPVVASATVDSRSGRLFSYYNPEAKEAEQRRREQERKERQKRGEQNAPLRGRGPDVRGLRLGMSLEQVWRLFQDEVSEWEGPRETPGEDRPYARPIVKILLKDGARIRAEFTSRVSGSQLFVFTYEQYYREDVSSADVIRKLEKKYGKPDGVDHRTSGTYWGSYDLVSAIQPGDKAFGPHGAFFKTHVSARRGTAEMLRIAFNDATLGYHDEAAVHQARKEEARRKFEESRTNEVKF